MYKVQTSARHYVGRALHWPQDSAMHGVHNESQVI